MKWFIIGALALITVLLISFRKLEEMERRIHTARMLKDAMHGMTLNTIGPIYGVEREPGELNRHFERRIMRAAVRGDKAYVKKPRPATGAKLDEIAKNHGLTRRKNETDAHLQDRIREVIMKRLNDQLEGGKA